MTSPTSNKSINITSRESTSSTSPTGSSSTRSAHSSASSPRPRRGANGKSRSPVARKPQNNGDERLPSTVGSPSSSNNSGGEINNMKVQLYKTKVCRHYMRGSCRYGSRCTFAHQLSELGARPDFYKTKMCARRNCKDANCQYAHSPEELRSPFGNSSPQVCLGALDGSCNDPNCKLSHNKTQAQESILAGALELSRQGRLGQNQHTQQQQQMNGVPAASLQRNNNSNRLASPVSSSLPAADSMAIPSWSVPSLMQSVPNSLPAHAPTSHSSPLLKTRSVQGQQQASPTVTLDGGNGQVNNQQPDLTDPSLLKALETLLAVNDQQSAFSESHSGTMPNSYTPYGSNTTDASLLPGNWPDFPLAGSESASYYLSTAVYGTSQKASDSLLGSATNQETM
ncbi:conserved hypothetical protein [Perkinsus marinus ATCC 50983]|uniref:C3H1-type domain-containing protein n=1 Tax=Perkinsus marinus (strain ATCC 50983 / TXsc) TaxID=423536 RepID=C5M074_PERM5|nr:conserved hypothetical protein [Perkinsus marinus ATCC 50983]EEQ97652.1 conserved hypothetical protein [Perkinsus marinus ATCC 50983]|eukprot:XP_002764935.1 conserved hypothetical protein [Perkinsus marinus ATCC 50983]